MPISPKMMKTVEALDVHHQYSMTTHRMMEFLTRWRRNSQKRASAKVERGAAHSSSSFVITRPARTAITLESEALITSKPRRLSDSFKIHILWKLKLSCQAAFDGAPRRMQRSAPPVLLGGSAAAAAATLLKSAGGRELARADDDGGGGSGGAVVTGLVALLWLLGCATTYASLGHLTSLDNESAAPIAANAATSACSRARTARSASPSCARPRPRSARRCCTGTRRARDRRHFHTVDADGARRALARRVPPARAAAPGDPAAAGARRALALGGLVFAALALALVAALVAFARGAPSHDRSRAARTPRCGCAARAASASCGRSRRARAGRRFALKVIEVDDVATANAGVLEATRLAECRHPNLLAAREQFFHNRWGEAHWLARLCVAPWELCIVMELCAEGSLWELLDRLWDADESLPERVILQVGAQLAGALACIHARGLVHRDVKPENVFVARRDADGALSVKLGDLGQALQPDAPRRAPELPRRRAQARAAAWPAPDRVGDRARGPAAATAPPRPPPRPRAARGPAPAPAPPPSPPPPAVPGASPPAAAAALLVAARLLRGSGGGGGGLLGARGAGARAARARARARGSAGARGGLGGTLGHIAPEIWADERYDTGADVISAWSSSTASRRRRRVAAIAGARALGRLQMLGDAALVMRRDPAPRRCSSTRGSRTCRACARCSSRAAVDSPSARRLDVRARGVDRPRWSSARAWAAARTRRFEAGEHAPRRHARPPGVL